MIIFLEALEASDRMYVWRRSISALGIIEKESKVCPFHSLENGQYVERKLLLPGDRRLSPFGGELITPLFHEGSEYPFRRRDDLRRVIRSEILLALSS